MAKSTASLLAFLLVACSGEAGGPAAPERAESRASNIAPAGALGSSAPPASATVVLPRLPGSAEGDAAALQGRLAAHGPCLYVDTNGGRYLVAALSPSLTWNPDARRLESGAASFGVGDRVMLGGSEAGRGASLPWTVAPNRQCDARRIWIASSISAQPA